MSRGVFPDPYWAHEYKKFQPELAEIAELRQLDRLGAAKQRWRFSVRKIIARRTTTDCFKPICE